MDRLRPGLYAILDLPHRRGLSADAACAALLREAPGLAAIQLRAKSWDTRRRVDALERLGPASAAAGVPLWVNDDPDAALAGVPGVVGVHLGVGDPGWDDVAGLRQRARRAGRADLGVGLSTHDLDQLHQACTQGPDYVAFGPVCATTSKARPDPVVGLDGLERACRAASRPLVAIGGLNGADVTRAVEVGAYAVAVISGLLAQDAKSVSARARALTRAAEWGRRLIDLEEVAAAIPVLAPEQLEDLGRWAGDLGTLLTLGLPARFRPVVAGGRVRYRPSDVRDLLYVMDKRPQESWEDWRHRNPRPELLVQLRL